VLKKAGIVVAAATASLLALSPLAFAGDKGDHDHPMPPPAPEVTQVDSTSRSPECDFGVQADNSVEQAGEGGNSLLGGVAGAVANTATPLNTQTQAPVGNCNNVEDVLDVTVEDNDRDNDETTTVEDSFNTED
jgi:hypothetical protein